MVLLYFYFDLTMVNDVRKVQEVTVYGNTVNPVLSGHSVKRAPSIKWTVAEVPKLISFITLNETFIKRTHLLRACRHLKSIWNGHFYCFQPVLNRLL